MTDSGKGDSKDRPLVSADDVRRIAGPVDDVTVAEILQMGPSFGELEAAAAYAMGDRDLDRPGLPLIGKVADLYEILTAEQELDEPGPR